MDRVKLLVVDDEQGIRDLVLEYFDGTSISCETAGNAEEALEKVTREQPDVVFLDIKLPGMDGLGALRRIKKIHQTAIVIIMTGRGTVDLAKQAMDLGTYEYVMKPFQMSEIKRLITKALNMRRLELQVALLREKASRKSTEEKET